MCFTKTHLEHKTSPVGIDVFKIMAIDEDDRLHSIVYNTDIPYKPGMCIIPKVYVPFYILEYETTLTAGVVHAFKRSFMYNATNIINSHNDIARKEHWVLVKCIIPPNIPYWKDDTEIAATKLYIKELRHIIAV